MTTTRNKTAQVLPGLPDDFPSVSSARPSAQPNSPSAHNTRVTPESDSSQPTAILQMQEAMASFYNTLKSYKLFSQTQQSPSSGSSSFLSLMLNRFVNKSDILGKQNSTDKENAKPNDLLKLIDTFKSFASNNRPDGQWGPLTNNALKNLTAFIQAMLSMIKSIGIEPSVFTDEDLQTLKSSIPSNHTISANNQEKLAETITKLLTSAKKLIGVFSDAVNNKFGSYINGNKSFNIGSINPKISYDPTLIENNPASLFNIKLPDDLTSPSGRTTPPLALGHIASKEAFDKFLEHEGISIDGNKAFGDPEITRKVIDYIENQIKNTPIGQPTQPSNKSGY